MEGLLRDECPVLPGRSPGEGVEITQTASEIPDFPSASHRRQYCESSANTKCVRFTVSTSREVGDATVAIMAGLFRGAEPVSSK